MEKVISLMIFFGAFIFIAMGLCVANSIEAKQSKIASNIMTIIMISGIASFLIGLIGFILI